MYNASPGVTADKPTLSFEMLIQLTPAQSEPLEFHQRCCLHNHGRFNNTFTEYRIEPPAPVPNRTEVFGTAPNRWQVAGGMAGGRWQVGGGGRVGGWVGGGGRGSVWVRQAQTVPNRTATFMTIATKDDRSQVGRTTASKLVSRHYCINVLPELSQARLASNTRHSSSKPSLSLCTIIPSVSEFFPCSGELSDLSTPAVPHVFAHRILNMRWGPFASPLVCSGNCSSTRCSTTGIAQLYNFQLLGQ